MTMTESPPMADWAPPQQAVITEGNQAHRRALKLLVLLAVVALAASAFVVASLAVFTDSTQSDGNSFTSGTVIITTDRDVTAPYAVSAMAPGDVEFRTFTVTNGGTLDLRYSLRSVTASGNQLFADALVFDVSSLDELSDCDATNWNNGAAGSTVLSAANPGSELSLATTGRQIFGNPSTTSGVAAGAIADDQTITTAAGTQFLCFRVELPLATSSSTLQGQTVAADFIFEAEQIDNN